MKLAFIYHENNLLDIVIEHKVYPIDKLYLGKISNILPSLDSAFVQLNQSKEKNGFIHCNNLKKDQSKQWNINSYKNKYFLVQITREPISNKGPTLSSNVTLKGKYLTLYPFQINKKNIYTINNKEYFQALKYLLNATTSSVMVKKEAITANVDFLLLELKNLKSNWIKTVKQSRKSTLPGSLTKKDNFILKLLRKYKNVKFESIYVDSYRQCLKVKKILAKINNSQTTSFHKTTIKYHRTEISLIKYFSLDMVIACTIKPRVNLYTGGYIVIEKTEALTTIDINSGSFKSLPNLSQASLWINYLAIHEIAKQLKLRNIGGIIVIDFIDSNNQYDQIKLLRYLNSLLKKDQTKCNIVQISELGLLELTRTRHGQSIYDAFSYKCKLCNGLGYISINLHVTQSHRHSLLLDFYPIFLKNQRPQM